MSKIKIQLINLLPNFIKLRIISKMFKSTINEEWSTFDKKNLVISGYPRSGNTFMWIYFKLYQPHLKLAHYIHNKYFLLYSLSTKVPTISLIRNPIDAIVSYIIFLESQGKKINYLDRIDYYFDFYYALTKEIYNKKLIIIDFDDMLINFDNTIRIICNNFNFQFEPTPDYNSIKPIIFNEINIFNDKTNIGNDLTIHKPSPKKNEHKQNIKKILENKIYQKRIYRCEKLYRYIVSKK